MITLSIGITIAVILLIFLTQIFDLSPPDLTFLAGAVALSLFGIISVNDVFSGFSNSGLITVAMLFVVARGVRDTGLLHAAANKVLGDHKSTSKAVVRMSASVLPISAFLNNTPIVAMFTPGVADWCKKQNLSPSKLLIPLSYLAILGGTCTLIGTSTNIIIGSLISAHSDVVKLSDASSSLIGAGLRELNFFEIGAVGLPYALIGVIYLWVFHRYLPERKYPSQTKKLEQRKFLSSLRLPKNSSLSGKSIENAGLRKLEELFLVSVERNKQLFSPVSPDFILESGDELSFSGNLDALVELNKIASFDVIDESSKEAHPTVRMWEVVLSSSSPLIGSKVKESDFRVRYNSAILAIHRNGQYLKGRLGEVTLKAGDTLVLQSGLHFRRAFRDHKDFLLVSSIPEWRPLNRGKSGIALLLLTSLILLMTSNVFPNALVATAIALAFVASKCLSASEARDSIDWSVIITIASAFAIGQAVEASGLARYIAENYLSVSLGLSAFWQILIFYFVISLITELITNNAAAILFFPVSLEIANSLQVDARPFIMTLILAASASFMTPIGYQTNMMVYGPGGYKFKDFMVFGGFLNLILGICAALLIPYIWRF
ncbi:SLC13 family permease [bacterium]|nr:SLC13 family permease [bacterium]